MSRCPKEIRKIYSASWILFNLTAEADRVLCQLVMSLTVFFHWMYKMKFSCYQEYSLLLFMAGLFIGYLVEKYVTFQSRKSDFGWHCFRFSPWLMCKEGWKVWSDTGLTWYLSGAASRKVRLSNYCMIIDVFISNLMKSSVVYAAILFMYVCKIWDNDLTEYLVWYKLTEL